MKNTLKKDPVEPLYAHHSVTTTSQKPARTGKATNLYLPAVLLEELKAVRKADESVSEIVSALLAEEIALRRGQASASRILAREIKRRG